MAMSDMGREETDTETGQFSGVDLGDEHDPMRTSLGGRGYHKQVRERLRMLQTASDHGVMEAAEVLGCDKAAVSRAQRVNSLEVQLLRDYDYLGEQANLKERIRTLEARLLAVEDRLDRGDGRQSRPRRDKRGMSSTLR